MICSALIPVVGNGIRVRDIYDNGSVLILQGSEVWVGTAQGQVHPTIVLFEMEEGVYCVEYDSTLGTAFDQLEAMASSDSFWIGDSDSFYRLDEMAFMMLRMVL